jgi:hypothetical protein
VKDNGESGSAQDKERPPARGADDGRLLSISDLEYIGLATSYLRQTGKENPLYTILGKPNDLPISNALQRSIRQVFFWDETTTYRVNELLMMVLNTAFDMSPFPNLVDTLRGMHAMPCIADHRRADVQLNPGSQGPALELREFAWLSPYSYWRRYRPSDEGCSRFLSLDEHFR